MLRYSLMVCLVASAAFAAWSWFRPYAWNSDPAARCKIVETMVTPDQSYFWVDIHLKVNSETSHDMEKPVRLEDSTGKIHEPGGTVFGKADDGTISDIWLKFWLEPSQINGPLTLYLNDGKLIVKDGPGTPDLGGSPYRNYTTNHW